jgi:hypothetical protein
MHDVLERPFDHFRYLHELTAQIAVRGYQNTDHGLLLRLAILKRMLIDCP